MAQIATTAALQALTEWWAEMGVEIDPEITTQNPKHTSAPNRESLSQPTSQKTIAPAPRSAPNRRLEDWISDARAYAETAQDLRALKLAIEMFEGSPLKPLCNKTVVFDGLPQAPVMVLGEGPGGQEDRIGRPFVGKAGQLLDKMLSAIGLDRQTNTFISNVNYWRPPGNRNPEADELAVCRPFVDRMIDLGAPKLIIATGGVAAKSLIETRTGIMRLRGTEVLYTTPAGTSVPMIPIFHPAYLLRRPQDKSRTWRDLLHIQTRLTEIGVDI